MHPAPHHSVVFQLPNEIYIHQCISSFPRSNRGIHTTELAETPDLPPSLESDFVIMCGQCASVELQTAPFNSERFGGVQPRHVRKIGCCSASFEDRNPVRVSPGRRERSRIDTSSPDRTPSCCLHTHHACSDILVR